MGQSLRRTARTRSGLSFDRLRECLGRMAVIAASNSGVGMGAPTARSAAQWALAPIASIRWLGWG